MCFTSLKAITDLIPFVNTYLLGLIVDFFTTYQKGNPLMTFYVLVSSMAFLGGLQVWLRFFAKMRVQDIAAKTREKLRLKAMTHLMDLELEWHENKETGSKLEKISTGAENIYHGANELVNNGINILSSMFGSLVFFIFLNWKHALFAIIYAVVYLEIERYYNKKIDYWEHRLRLVREKVAGKFHESASNLLTVKSLGLRNVFRKLAKKYEKEYYDVWVQTRNVSQNKSKLVKSFAAIGQAFFIFLLGKDVLTGMITVGSIVVFYNYFGKLRGSLDNITNHMNRFIKIKTSIGGLMRLLSEKVFDKENGEQIPKNWAAITFKNLTFKYKDKLVLDNFNLKIREGEKIGIVGTSGTGKSTLVKILLGLYKSEKGQILIANKPIEQYKHSSMTKLMSIVLQDSEMFNMNLLDNITISTTRNDKKLLVQALEISNLKKVARKLPKGLRTLIGEKGYKLSDGERQRVGLARAIYKNTPVLILDEATSHLDSETENQIQKKIETLDKTLLVIAHRLSTLRNVDRIIVIDKGKIVEEGTFNDLISKQGKFYGLYNLQKNK